MKINNPRSIIKNKIRVRFAPSPTGFLHLGALRTVLYDYLFVKQRGGELILRIEDTDQVRSVDGAVKNILKTLRDLGLDWDEGVIGENKDQGDYGPYFQSQRLEIYQKYAQELIVKNQAYYCFCSKKRLEKLRQDQQAIKQMPRYDGKCRDLSAQEVEKKIQSKNPYVIRLKMPRVGESCFEDIIRGKICFKNELIDDQVLIKSDGFATYHLASVVDDYLMKITHVLRGEEWLSSVPKHLKLYEAFGWKIPRFAHLPLILNSDRSKLSKRQGEVAVEDYLAQGYLPEALLNFVALLGWNPRGDQEVYTLEELIKEFNLKNINKAGAVFNIEKLDWLNGYYIRRLDLQELTKRCRDFLSKGQSDEYYGKVVALEQARLKKLSEIKELAHFFFSEPEYEASLLIWKKMDKSEVKLNLEIIKEFLEKLEKKDFSREILEKKIKDFIEERGLETGKILWPLRVALTGEKTSPSPFEVAEILAKKRVLGRIEQALRKIG